MSDESMSAGSLAIHIGANLEALAEGIVEAKKQIATVGAAEVKLSIKQPTDEQVVAAKARLQSALNVSINVTKFTGVTAALTALRADVKARTTGEGAIKVGVAFDSAAAIRDLQAKLNTASFSAKIKLVSDGNVQGGGGGAQEVTTITRRRAGLRGGGTEYQETYIGDRLQSSTRHQQRLDVGGMGRVVGQTIAQESRKFAMTASSGKSGGGGVVPQVGLGLGEVQSIAAPVRKEITKTIGQLKKEIAETAIKEAAKPTVKKDVRKMASQVMASSAAANAPPMLALPAPAGQRTMAEVQAARYANYDKNFSVVKNKAGLRAIANELYRELNTLDTQVADASSKLAAKHLNQISAANELFRSRGQDGQLGYSPRAGSPLLPFIHGVARRKNAIASMPDSFYRELYDRGSLPAALPAAPTMKALPPGRGMGADGSVGNARSWYEQSIIDRATGKYNASSTPIRMGPVGGSSSYTLPGAIPMGPNYVPSTALAIPTGVPRGVPLPDTIAAAMGRHGDQLGVNNLIRAGRRNLGGAEFAFRPPPPPPPPDLRDALHSWDSNFNRPFLGAFGRFAQKLRDGIEDKIKKLEGDARRHFFAGMTLSGAFTAPAIGIAAVSMMQAREFEKSMALSGALTDIDPRTIGSVNGPNLPAGQNLSKDILNMSGELPQRAKELADSLYYVASTGLKGTDALNVLRVSARAAAGGLGETQVVANTVTSVLTAYNLTAGSAGRVTDVLTAAVRVGKGEADQYAGAMAKVIPIAAQVGVSFEEVAANMATMTRVGFTTSQASTGLTNLLNKLAAPTKQGKVVLGKMELDAHEVRKSLKSGGLMNTLNEIIKRSGGGVEMLRPLLGNVYGLNNILATSGRQPRAYAESLDAMRNAAGSADHAFEQMSKTADMQLNRLRNSFSKVAIEIGSELLPSVTSAAKDLADNMPKYVGAVRAGWDALPDSIQGATKSLGLFLVAAGPMLMLVSLLKNIQAAALMTAAVGNPLIWAPVAVGWMLALNAGTTGAATAAELLTTNMTAAGLAIKVLVGYAGVLASMKMAGLVSGAASGVAAASASYRAAAGSALMMASVPGGVGFMKNVAVHGYEAAHNAAVGMSGVVAGGGMMAPGAAVSGQVTSAGALGALGVGTMALGIASIGPAVMLAASAWQEYTRSVTDAETHQHNLEVSTKEISKHLAKASYYGRGAGKVSESISDIQSRFEETKGSEPGLTKLLRDLDRSRKSVFSLKMHAGDKQKLFAEYNSVKKQIEAAIIEVRIKPVSWQQGLRDSIGALGQNAGMMGAGGGAWGFASNALRGFGIPGYINNGIVDLGGAMANVFSGHEGRMRATDTREAARARGSAWGYQGGPQNLSRAFNGFPAGALAASSAVSSIDKVLDAKLEKLFGVKGLSGKSDDQLTDWIDRSASRKSVTRARYMLDKNPALSDALSGSSYDTLKDREARVHEAEKASRNGMGHISQAEEDKNKSKAKSLEELRSGYNSYQSVMSGLSGKIREFSEKTEEARIRNEMLKKSMAGVSDEFKNAAVSVAKLYDQMKAFGGVKDALSGGVIEHQKRLISYGILEDPNQGLVDKVEKSMSFSPIMKGLQSKALSISSPIESMTEQIVSRLDTMIEVLRNPSATGASGGSGGPAPSWLTEMEADAGKTFGRNCAVELQARLRAGGASIGSMAGASQNKALQVGIDADGKLPAGTIVRYPPGRGGYKRGHYMAVGSDRSHWTEANYVGPKDAGYISSGKRAINWASLGKDIASGVAFAFSPGGAATKSIASAATKSPLDYKKSNGNFKAAASDFDGSFGVLATPEGRHMAALLGGGVMGRKRKPDDFNFGRLKDWGNITEEQETTTQQFALQLRLFDKEFLKNYASLSKLGKAKTDATIKESIALAKKQDATFNTLKSNKQVERIVAEYRQRDRMIGKDGSAAYQLNERFLEGDTQFATRQGRSASAYGLTKNLLGSGKHEMSMFARQQRFASEAAATQISGAGDRGFVDFSVARRNREQEIWTNNQFAPARNFMEASGLQEMAKLTKDADEAKNLRLKATTLRREGERAAKLYMEGFDKTASDNASVNIANIAAEAARSQANQKSLLSLRSGMFAGGSGARDIEEAAKLEEYRQQQYDAIYKESRAGGATKAYSRHIASQKSSEMLAGQKALIMSERNAPVENAIASMRDSIGASLASAQARLAMTSMTPGSQQLSEAQEMLRIREQILALNKDATEEQIAQAQAIQRPVIMTNLLADAQQRYLDGIRAVSLESSTIGDDSGLGQRYKGLFEGADGAGMTGAQRFDLLSGSLDSYRQREMLAIGRQGEDANASTIADRAALEAKRVMSSVERASLNFSGEGDEQEWADGRISALAKLKKILDEIAKSKVDTFATDSIAKMNEGWKEQNTNAQEQLELLGAINETEKARIRHKFEQLRLEQQLKRPLTDAERAESDKGFSAALPGIGKLDTTSTFDKMSKGLKEQILLARENLAVLWAKNDSERASIHFEYELIRLKEMEGKVLDENQKKELKGQISELEGLKQKQKQLETVRAFADKIRDSFTKALEALVSPRKDILRLHEEEVNWAQKEHQLFSEGISIQDEAYKRAKSYHEDLMKQYKDQGGVKGFFKTLFQQWSDMLKQMIIQGISARLTNAMFGEGRTGYGKDQTGPLGNLRESFAATGGKSGGGIVGKILGAFGIPVPDVGSSGGTADQNMRANVVNVYGQNVTLHGNIYGAGTEGGVAGLQNIGGFLGELGANLLGNAHRNGNIPAQGSNGSLSI